MKYPKLIKANFNEIMSANGSSCLRDDDKIVVQQSYGSYGSYELGINFQLLFSREYISAKKRKVFRHIYFDNSGKMNSITFKYIMNVQSIGGPKKAREIINYVTNNYFHTIHGLSTLILERNIKTVNVFGRLIERANGSKNFIILDIGINNVIQSFDNLVELSNRIPMPIARSIFNGKFFEFREKFSKVEKSNKNLIVKLNVDGWKNMIKITSLRNDDDIASHSFQDDSNDDLVSNQVSSNDIQREHQVGQVDQVSSNENKDQVSSNENKDQVDQVSSNDIQSDDIDSSDDDKFQLIVMPSESLIDLMDDNSKKILSSFKECSNHTLKQCQESSNAIFSCIHKLQKKQDNEITEMEKKMADMEKRIEEKIKLLADITNKLLNFVKPNPIEAANIEEEAKSIEAANIEEEAKSIEEEAKSIEEEPKSIEEEAKSIEEELKSIEAANIEEEPKSIEEEPKSIEEDIRQRTLVDSDAEIVDADEQDTDVDADYNFDNNSESNNKFASREESTICEEGICFECFKSPTGITKDIIKEVRNKVKTLFCKDDDFMEEKAYNIARSLGEYKELIRNYSDLTNCEFDLLEKELNEMIKNIKINLTKSSNVELHAERHTNESIEHHTFEVKETSRHIKKLSQLAPTVLYKVEEEEDINNTEDFTGNMNKLNRGKDNLILDGGKELLAKNGESIDDCEDMNGEEYISFDEYLNDFEVEKVITLNLLWKQIESELNKMSSKEEMGKVLTFFMLRVIEAKSRFNIDGHGNLV